MRLTELLCCQYYIQYISVISLSLYVCLCGIPQGHWVGESDQFPVFCHFGSQQHGPGAKWTAACGSAHRWEALTHYYLLRRGQPQFYISFSSLPFFSNNSSLGGAVFSVSHSQIIIAFVFLTVYFNVLPKGALFRIKVQTKLWMVVLLLTDWSHKSLTRFIAWSVSISLKTIQCFWYRLKGAVCSFWQRLVVTL